MFTRFAVTLWIVSLLALPAWAAEHTKDSLPEVKEKVEQGKAVLVDVREKPEWEQGYVKDAILLSMSQLQGEDRIDPEKLEKILPQDKVLYTYCRSGVRSLTSGKILEELGYEVKVLKPGFEDLKAAGFETKE